MKPILETDKTATFLLNNLGKQYFLRLYKRKHWKQIMYLKKLPSSKHLSFNELGVFLYEMENRRNIPGVFNGADYLKVLSIEFL